MTKVRVPHLLRMVQLKRAGLSNAATAIVLSLDFGGEFNADQVRYYVRRYAPGLPRGRGRVSHDNGNLR